MNESRLQQLFHFLELAPDDAFTLYSIAYEYMQGEEYEQSLEYWDRLKKISPDYVGMYLHLGRLYEKIKRPDKALETYEEGILIARSQKNLHALSELQAAIDDL